MWKLKPLTQAQNYYDIVLQPILENLARSGDSITQIIDEAYVRKLLVAMPSELMGLNDDFNICCTDVHRDLWLKRVFDYTTILGGANGFKFAHLIGHQTCVYCNRSYTTTVFDENKTGVIRPQFDHFYDKATYPLLALCFYNLIPCCALCNSSWIKGQQSIPLNPYELQPDEKFSFKYLRLPNNEFRVVIETNSPKVQTTLEVMKTEEIYRSHEAFELRDMIHLRTLYGDTYIEELSHRMGHLVSMEDIYRSVLGVELDPTKDFNRPLSQFRRDILTQLGVLKEKT